MNVKFNTIDTVRFALHMAGDIEEARRALRRFAFDHGECVTLAAERFIYTAGEEDGFVVGLVAYPRFPRVEQQLRERIHAIAHLLLEACCQRTCLVVGDRYTTWIVRSVPGAAENP